MAHQSATVGMTRIKGHFFALLTILIWSSTFIVSKILLNQLTPIQILITRFLIAIIFLSVLSPKFVKPVSLKEEALFLAVGTALAGYFVCENSALQHTYSSNVSLIVATIPLITGLLSMVFFKTRFLNLRSTIGFVLAYTGVWVIMTNGQAVGGDGPVGDLLALGAAILFAIYSLLMQQVTGARSLIQMTRKVFLYGLIALAVTAIIQGRPFAIRQVDGKAVLSLLFLGIVASSLAFLLWNHAIRHIGPVMTSQYIYLVPVVTTAMAAVVLKETITVRTVAGTGLILAGLVLSERSQAAHRQSEKIGASM